MRLSLQLIALACLVLVALAVEDLVRILAALIEGGQR